ncbi:MAG: selenocysteine-specific translation elongation factor, partial [bacterium]|nr:selenocysteine-specific translation elongation factor [bacterium]
MQRVVIGTAGHIDHGKTRLIEALTGIDCDRWAEEKARGITIDLGFAHLEHGDVRIGFVDVPGHERFLHNALAGLGGIRIMLLVIAADEGVKPQTREHLAICELLGIPHAVAVLSKRDLVEQELLELAELEVEELLESSPYAGAPVVAVSSTTGDGIAELREILLARAREVAVPNDPTQPVRLPIDRAFQLRGLGVIVTGTLISGRLEVGQTLTLQPGDESLRIRSLQVHGRSRESAEAGQRTAAQLSGVELGSLARGKQLAAAEAFATTRSLCARMTLLPDAPEELTSFVSVRFHLYSCEVLGKLRPLAGEPLEPGQSGLVEIRLSQPVVAIRGDRFIVRRPSPATTLGGGEILDPLWRRRRGKPLREALRAAAERRSALELWVREAGERGAMAAELAPRLGCRDAELREELDQLVSDNRLLRVDSGRGRRWIAPVVCQRVMERARKVLRSYLESERLARGMPKAQFLGRTLPRRAADLADVYLTWFEAERILIREGDLVNLPGRSVELTGEESQLARSILAQVEAAGLTPPSPGEVHSTLGAKPQIAEGVMRYLLQQGKLTRLPSGLILSSAAIDGLRKELVACGWQQFTVSQFKERFDLSRKWAIPL